MTDDQMSPLPLSWVSFLVGLFQEEEREQRTQKRQQIALTRTDLWLASLLVFGNSLLDLGLQPALRVFPHVNHSSSVPDRANSPHPVCGADQRDNCQLGSVYV